MIWSKSIFFNYTHTQDTI